ncbi:hypothetical protein [Streptomyces sp. NBC_01483]|uniref:hypothetical protein n=1 Tax=Streptomyces sp. NBC_01483 TaxID=2903883 RepID=UPI002E34742B|nr:hypothetical protein [Streptomyces sp. NBC_01483]
MSTSELLTRLLIPTILIVSVAGLRIAFWWEKHRPTVPAHVAEMAAWRRLSTQEQAAADAEAIAEGMVADGFDAAARARAEESVRRAVQRATEVNALFRP